MAQQVLEQAVGRVRSGDREAFREVVLRTAVPLRAYVLFFLNDPAAADDLVQDVFVRAYREIGGYAAGTDFLAWLKTMARNAALAERRRRERKASAHRRYCREVEDRLSAEAVRREEAVPVEAQGEALRRCLEQLPDRVRSLVSLRYHQGLSAREAGERSGFGPSAAGTALHRARLALADCMERQTR